MFVYHMIAAFLSFRFVLFTQREFWASTDSFHSWRDRPKWNPFLRWVAKGVWRMFDFFAPIIQALIASEANEGLFYRRRKMIENPFFALVPDVQAFINPIFGSAQQIEWRRIFIIQNCARPLAKSGKRNCALQTGKREPVAISSGEALRRFDGFAKWKRDATWLSPFHDSRYDASFGTLTI